MTQPFKVVPQLAVSITRPTKGSQRYGRGMGLSIWMSRQSSPREISLTCHDKGILHQSEFATNPIPFDAHNDLAKNNADYLKIGDGRDPIRIALGELGPAGGPDGGEQGRQVTDGEQACGISIDPRPHRHSARDRPPKWPSYRKHSEYER
jgi:hypothetical protein